MILSKRLSCGAACATVLMLLSAGCGSNSGDTFPAAGPVTLRGASTTISRAEVFSWATIATDGSVTEAGVTLPYSVIQNPPAAEGSGPAGAIAVLAFPPQVQNTTFLRHFEMQWEAHGHPPALYMVPHFDLHFYTQTPEEVAAIVPGTDIRPADSQIPAGYLWTGDVVPQMGVHAVNLAEVSSGAPFTATMIAGFYKGQQTFVEPMITRETLLSKQTIVKDVPQAAVMGRSTRYPTKFHATYDPATDSYNLVFSGFVSAH